MKITIDREDESTLKITTQFFKDPNEDPQSKHDFEVLFTKFSQTLKKIGKEISMPGFRPGTVPPNIIKSKYGKQVMWDSLIEIVQDTVKMALEQNGISVVGLPLIDHSEKENLDLKTPKDYTIVMYAGYIPSFDIKFEDLPKIKRYEILYDDNDIDIEIKNWQANFGATKKANEVTLLDKFYSLKFKLIAVDEKGEKIVLPATEDIANNSEEGANKSEVVIDELSGVFNSWASKTFSKLFFGKKSGQKYILNPSELMSVEEESPFDSPFLSPKTQDHFNNNTLQLEVLEIREITPHPMNKDLYKKILGENAEIKNEVQFLDAYKQAFEVYVEQLSLNQLKSQIFNGFIFKQDVKLPVKILGQGFVEEFKKNYPDHTNDQLNEGFNNYMSELHKTAVYNQMIASLAEVEVSEASFREFLKDNIRVMFMDDGSHLQTLKSELQANVAKEKREELRGTLHDDIIDSMDDEELEEETGLVADDDDDIAEKSDDLYLEMMVNNLVNSKDYDFQSNFNNFAENKILSYLIDNKLEVEDEKITYKHFLSLT